MFTEEMMLKPKNYFIVAAVVLVVLILVACGAKDITKPGKAVNLTGDPVAGKVIYDGYCKSCHGPAGTGGIANPGSDDGTVPELNPIDMDFSSHDQFLYALSSGNSMINAFAVNDDGSLSSIGSFSSPAGAAGLAAR